MELAEMITSGSYPAASPPRDAPSPTANDDPFREGVEEAFERMCKVITAFSASSRLVFGCRSHFFKGLLSLVRFLGKISAEISCRTSNI